MNKTNRVLFLCTGNYYRSRYAEEIFNHQAGLEGLGWHASSRAVAEKLFPENVGPVQSHVATDHFDLGDTRGPQTPSGTARAALPMLERANFADDLADLQKSTCVEFGMTSLHGFDMVGMGPPAFERLL